MVSTFTHAAAAYALGFDRAENLSHPVSGLNL